MRVILITFAQQQPEIKLKFLHETMSKLKSILSILPEPISDCYLNYKYAKQLKTWENKGCPLPTPHIVKQLVIKSYQETNNVDTLIETGTYLGDMVYAQRKTFKNIYSIELSKQLHERAVKRFKKYSSIEILQGDSGVVLDSIIKNLNNKSIFWLDGHYSGGFTAKGSTECPIIEELNTIFKSKYEHIILIDDAREFNGENDYPSIKELESLIRNSGFPNSSLTIQDDIIRIELKY